MLNFVIKTTPGGRGVVRIQITHSFLDYKEHKGHKGWRTQRGSLLVLVSSENLVMT